MRQSLSKKIRKFAIFLIFPVHLFLTYGMKGKSSGLMTAMILITLFADAVLSFLQLGIFTSKRNRIGLFASDFLPYLLEKVLIGAAEWGIFAYTGGVSHNILSGSWGKGLFFAVSLITMALVAVVTFVTGAARTMMYHDEKR